MRSDPEQVVMGAKQGIEVVESFDGLGFGFAGPQGTTHFRNPSDNSLAVGPNHIVQTVNARMAIFTKKGKIFSKTGEVLYGPEETRKVFEDFGGPCENINNGDAVVRYDQLADRWLLVMPTFRRAPLRNDSLLEKRPQPGPAFKLKPGNFREEPPPGPRKKLPPDTVGAYCMCYAVSTTSDPLGSWYRYEFRRELFPDYPRPAVWPDGYYNTTSTGDHLNERHLYVVDRNSMLRGLPATEQHFILKDVNFVVPADLEGQQLPPYGSPAILLATGGDQLNKITTDNGIYVWKQYTNWKNPSQSRLEGPIKLEVPTYHYLGGGQLTNAVPQPGTNIRLDAQGDKIMARLVYRRMGKTESMVAVHSVATAAGGGGVRWYEFRVNQKDRTVKVQQLGTYTPSEGDKIPYRWMASPAMDKDGNIGIGYSFGSSIDFPGQRFAAQSAGGPEGVLDNKEVVLVEGQASQENTLRWEDYTQTAMDPSDDKTIWYVGDYLKKGAKDYSTRIAAIRIR
ncbi:MAG: hypothetical protein FJZ78_09485 [Bacteroidetes bacterium]|nr:hypothetical protein [Bacteroidota bacterium]